MKVVSVIQRRLARAYHLHCAREDVRRHGLVVPAGVWICQHCPKFSFDAGLLGQHMVFDHR
jgi:hypothetical protein